MFVEIRSLRYSYALFGWKVNTIHRYERRHAYFCIRGANAGLMAASTKWEDEITAKYLFINRQQQKQ